MTYECTICRWADEVKTMPKICGRCKAMAHKSRTLTDNEEFDAQNTYRVMWCVACKHFHTR